MFVANYRHLSAICIIFYLLFPKHSLSQTLPNLNGENLIIMNPLIEFVDVSTGKVGNAATSVRDSIMAKITDETKIALDNCKIGFLVTSQETQISDSIYSSLFKRLIIDGHLSDSLKALSFPMLTGEIEPAKVLLARCRLHIGSGGSWDPFSGAITSGSSRIVLDYQLFDLAANQVLWSYSAQERKPPTDVKRCLKEMVETIFPCKSSKKKEQ